MEPILGLHDGEEILVEATPSHLRIGVSMRKDEETGGPLIGVRVVKVAEGITTTSETFLLRPAQAQELGAALIGAASTAAIFEHTIHYLGMLLRAGRPEEADAISTFMEWLSADDMPG